MTLPDIPSLLVDSGNFALYIKSANGKIWQLTVDNDGIPITVEADLTTKGYQF